MGRRNENITFIPELVRVPDLILWLQILYTNFDRHQGERSHYLQDYDLSVPFSQAGTGRG